MKHLKLIILLIFVTGSTFGLFAQVELTEQLTLICSSAQQMENLENQQNLSDRDKTRLEQYKRIFENNLNKVKSKFPNLSEIDFEWEGRRFIDWIPGEVMDGDDSKESTVASKKNISDVFASSDLNTARTFLEKMVRSSNKGLKILNAPSYDTFEATELKVLYGYTVDKPTKIADSLQNPFEFLEDSEREAVTTFWDKYEDYQNQFGGASKISNMRETYGGSIEFLVQKMSETIPLLESEPLEQDVNSLLMRNLRVIDMQINALTRDHNNPLQLLTENQRSVLNRFNELSSNRTEQIKQKELAEKEKQEKLEREAKAQRLQRAIELGEKMKREEESRDQRAKELGYSRTFDDQFNVYCNEIYDGSISADTAREVLGFHNGNQNFEYSQIVDDAVIYDYEIKPVWDDDLRTYISRSRQIAVIKEKGVIYAENSSLREGLYAFLDVVEFERRIGGSVQLLLFRKVD